MSEQTNTEVNYGCPACGSHDLHFTAFEETNRVTLERKILCGKCKFTFTEVFEYARWYGNWELGDEQVEWYEVHDGPRGPDVHCGENNER